MACTKTIKDITKKAVGKDCLLCDLVSEEKSKKVEKMTEEEEDDLPDLEPINAPFCWFCELELNYCNRCLFNSTITNYALEEKYLCPSCFVLVDTNLFNFGKEKK